jgi:hypothetical protein
MAQRIQLRNDSTANWAAVNPVLAQGEVGVDVTLGRLKIGDGTTAWNTLDFMQVVLVEAMRLLHFQISLSTSLEEITSQFSTQTSVGTPTVFGLVTQSTSDGPALYSHTQLLQMASSKSLTRL